jgi:excinuclease ABC subunit B
MDRFTLHSPYQPAGDQPQAIDSLVRNLKAGDREQVLIGVTGSGKTFTLASTIAAVNKPTLVISHNKTLAAQLYQEFKEFFPENSVSYFVSYYDYYQPEAYIPQTDTYIEKETEINEEIDKLRLAATMNILTRPDTIVVASVSCIYNIGSPREYGQFVLELKTGMAATMTSIVDRLVALQYSRDDWTEKRSTFRLRGDAIDVRLAYEDTSIRIVVGDGKVQSIQERTLLDGTPKGDLPATVIYPSKHYMTDPTKYEAVFKQMEADMEAQTTKFAAEGKIVEAHRLRQRITHDIEMIREVGYVNGIENYSRYFDGRKPGDPPFTLMDYFTDSKRDWLMVIDESHMTVPQIRGMYNGDRSRKQTLIDFGFRLPAALDNRPLMFDEFQRRIPQVIYVSATPDEWELSRADHTVEQLVRPTGLVDPEVEIRPTEGQIPDVIREVSARAAKNERTLVTTLTKQMAEDLTNYLTERGIKVSYLHSDVETLDRTEILAGLRLGNVDAIVGVNLLREGLDLPEVSLVVILDADKEGFLRSRTSLVQTMGRAARHINGRAILYASTMTDSMKAAIDEVKHRREVQLEFNRTHGITPQSIVKSIRPELVEREHADGSAVSADAKPSEDDWNSMTPMDKNAYIKELGKRMREASKNLDFESAARIRDMIQALKKEV